MHLLRRREIGLSSANARPGRTSYCALLNIIYVTIYFMDTNGNTEKIWRRTNHIGRIGVPHLSRQKSLGKEIATVRLSRNRSVVPDQAAHRRAPAPQLDIIIGTCFYDNIAHGWIASTPRQEIYILVHSIVCTRPILKAELPLVNTVDERVKGP